MQSLTGDAMQVSQKMPRPIKTGSTGFALQRASQETKHGSQPRHEPDGRCRPHGGSFSNAESACTKAYRR